MRRPSFLALLPIGVLLGAVPLVALQACGGGGSAEPAPLDSGAPADASDGSGGDDAQPDVPFELDGGGVCPQGQACGDGGAGQCVGGNLCCDRALACGDACCASGSVCSFGKCATPGAVCVDATDCKATEICDYSLGAPITGPGDAGVGEAGSGDAGDGGVASCKGGAAQKSGRCLPRPPQCAPIGGGDAGLDGGASGDGGADAGGSLDLITCLDKCEWRPPAAAFAPAQKFAWGDPAALGTADSVMMMPVVIELDDDDCDGLVTERDVPEIVFTTFANGAYTANGTLHAISIIGGKVVEKWKVAPSVTDAVSPSSQIAAGNFDGKPGNELVVCAAGPKLRAFDAKGKDLWTSPLLTGCGMPSIADLDGDGIGEIVTEGNIVDGATGKILATLSGSGGTTTVADVTGDGVPDIVGPTKIWDAKGVVIADATAATVIGGALPAGSYVAVGDFDRDGVPEIVAAHSGTHQMSVWHYVATLPSKVQVLRRTFDINGPLSPSLCPVGSSGNTRGGGPPTIADFNGDGTPDVALAGGVGYAVFDGKKLLSSTVTDPTLWIKQTHDCSSAVTGSSVFDFDGDGKAEVIYSDEYYLRIYRGTDGAELWKTCNTTGTLVEYPVIADVDNDGHADIVVASNSYSGITCPDDGSKQAGVRVFGDKIGQWVRTRRVWNEHAYHVTNVAEDGTIPKSELPNWTQPRLDNFRQNVQPLGEFSAPDLVVSVRPSCGSPYGLVARVRNLGEAAVEAPVVVGFYAGATKLGTATTTQVLYPAESEDVVLTLASPPSGVLDGTTLITAVVDDGAPPHAWHECRTDNNRSATASGHCSGPM